MKIDFKKNLKTALLVIIIALFLFIGCFFVNNPPEPAEITWGVNFSQKHAQDLKLDWKKTYLSLIDDLGAKNLKIATYWDLLEPEKDIYNFADLDWQIKTAEGKEAKILLVIGMKTPRWPECHIPAWAKNLSQEGREKEILELLKQIVLRYTGQSCVSMWQVENEPFLPFGECPKIEKEFIKQEVNLVKSLDPKNRPVIISDSGEWSFWTKAAQCGDIVGITIYKKVWFQQGGFYISWPYNPMFYWRRAQIIKALFDKEVICIELQAEPWGPILLYDSPIQEQEKTMNLEQFQKNVGFASKTGLKRFYLWGGEWWYWLKTRQNKPEIWNEAQKLF